MVFLGEKKDHGLTIHHEHATPSTIKPTEQVIDSETGYEEGGESMAVEGSVKDLPPGYFRSFHFVGTMIAVWCGYTACYSGFVLPSNVLTIINQDLGPDPNYTMIGTVVALTQAVIFSLVGRLSDLFGRRWFFIVGNVVGLVGAIIAATAKSIPSLIGGTLFIGLASGVQISYPTLVSELVPNKWRAPTLAIVATSITPFAVFGSVIVRAFILYTSAGWRWTYYLAIILNGLAVVFFYFCYFPPTYTMLQPRRAAQGAMWKVLDIGGLGLFIIGMVLLLLGISFGNTLYPWTSGLVIAFIIVGFAVLVIFIFWEIHGAGDCPLIPMVFFRNRGFVAVIILASVGYMVFFALLLLYPMELEVLYSSSSMDVGWKSCINPAFVIVGQILSGSFLKLIGRHRWQLVFWTMVLTAFTGAMAATTPSTPIMFYVFISIVATAIGFVENATLVLASLTLQDSDIGIALGLLGTMRGVFAAVGQAIFVAILDSRLTINIPKYVVADAVEAGLLSKDAPTLLEGLPAGNFSAVPGITKKIIAAAEAGQKMAYSESFKDVYLAAIAFGVISMAAAFSIPSLEKKFTNTVARRLHRRDALEADESDQKAETANNV